MDHFYDQIIWDRALDDPEKAENRDFVLLDSIRVMYDTINIIEYL